LDNTVGVCNETQGVNYSSAGSGALYSISFRVFPHISGLVLCTPAQQHRVCPMALSELKKTSASPIFKIEPTIVGSSSAAQLKSIIIINASFTRIAETWDLILAL
jgi:hypothetical protein